MKNVLTHNLSNLKWMFILGLMAPSALVLAEGNETQSKVIFQESAEAEAPATPATATPAKTRTHDVTQATQKADEDALARRSAATREYYISISNDMYRKGQDQFIAGEFEAAVQSYHAARAEIIKCYSLTDSVANLDETLLKNKKDDEFVKWPETVKKRIVECDKAIAQAYHKWAEQLISEADGLFIEGDPAKAERAIECLQKAKKIWPEYTPMINKKEKECEDWKNGLEVRRNTSEQSVYPEKDNRNYRINMLMQQGKNFLAVKRLDDAREKFNEVRRLDPYNLEAANQLRLLAFEYRRIAFGRYKATRHERMSEVMNKYVQPLSSARLTDPDEGATPADDSTEGPADASVAKPISPLEEKLNTIIIDNMNYEDIPISSAITFLRERAKLQDRDGVGVNIILKIAAPDEEGKPVFDIVKADQFFHINLDLAERISLREAIENICANGSRPPNVKLDYIVDDACVIIYSDNMSIEKVTTRMWPVSGEDVFSDNTEELKAFFEDQGVNFKSTQTAVIYDQKSRLLTATNTSRELAKIDDIVSEMGEKERQVSTVVRFVEVTQEDLNELGFDWMLTRIPPEGADINSIPFRFGTAVSEADQFNFPNTTTSTTNLLEPFPVSSDGNVPQPAANALRSLGSSGIGTRYGSSTSTSITPVYDKAFWWRYTADRRTGSEIDPSVPNNWGKNWTNGVDVDIAIRAIAQAQSNDVLSCPRITTREGEQAVIKMITRIFYPTSWSKPQFQTLDVNNVNVNQNQNNNNNNENANQLPIGIIGSTPEFRDYTEIGIVLTVTPFIEDVTNIRLEMNPVILSFVEWLEYSYNIGDMNGDGNVGPEEQQKIKMPSIERREVLTKVKVNSGSTLVMGGALKDKTYTLRDRIPILGDIPLIGRFFRTEAENATKSNLLIFVTPEIVFPDGRPDPTRVEEYVGVPKFN